MTTKMRTTTAPDTGRTSPSIVPSIPPTRATRRGAILGILAAGFGAGAAAALPAPEATMEPAAGTALSDSRTSLAGHAAIVERAELAVDLLRTRYIRDGWAIDEATTAKMLSLLQAKSPLDEEDNGAGFAMVEFCDVHNQSLDWLVQGDPGGMICDRASRSRRAASLADSADVALLQLIEQYKSALEEAKRLGREFEPYEERCFERRKQRREMIPEGLRQRADDIEIGIPEKAAKDGWYTETRHVEALAHDRWSNCTLSDDLDTIVSQTWTPSEAACVRGREIADAYKRWQRWIERKPAGYNAAERARDQADRRLWDLEDEVFATPARTLAGLAAKARIAAGPAPNSEALPSLVRDIIALANAGSTAVTVMKAPDPTFAAIERHRKAWAVFDERCSELDDLDTRESKAEWRRLMDAVDEGRDAISRPTTVAGAIAVLRYAADPRNDIFEKPTQFMHAIADALENIAVTS
jgi:hypothetical protein